MTTHPRFEETQGVSLSRRHLVQALTVGAAATVATPALANESAVVAEATDADYLRDPTR